MEKTTKERRQENKKRNKRQLEEQQQQLDFQDITTTDDAAADADGHNNVVIDAAELIEDIYEETENTNEQKLKQRGAQEVDGCLQELLTNVIATDTQVQENHKPPTKKIRKINTDLSDQEEEEETLEHSQTKNKVLKMYNNLCKKQVRI